MNREIIDTAEKIERIYNCVIRNSNIYTISFKDRDIHVPFMLDSERIEAAIEEYKKVDRNITVVIDFQNTIFNEKCYFKGVYYAHFIFNNAIFKKEAIFNEFTIASEDTKVNFYKTTFEASAFFAKAMFNSAVNFTGTSFAKGNIIFELTKFSKGVSFQEVIFGNGNKCDLIDFRKAKFNDILNFQNAEVNASEIKFNEAVFKQKCDFYGTKFDTYCSFIDIKVYDLFVLNHSIFKNELLIQNLTFVGEVDCRDSIFESKLNIESVIFSKNTFFSGAYFNLTNINFVNFEDYVDFYHAQFKDAFYLDEVDFKGKVIFNDSQFSKEVQFTNCNFHDTVKFVNISSIIEQRYLPSFHFKFSTIEKLFLIDANPYEREKKNDFSRIRMGDNLSFEYCFFLDTSLLILRSLQGNSASSLNFGYANILGNIVLQNIDIDSLSLENATVTGNISIVDSVIIKKLKGRHTACVLKNEMQKVNDRVNYLKYRKEEHIQIGKDYFDTPKPNSTQKKLLRWFNGIFEWIVIILNYLSNNFGRSWIQGCFFTIIIAFITVSILQYKADYIFFTLDWHEWREYLPIFWNNVLCYMWLPDMLNIDLKEWEKSSITIYILGKILVGFGIYQTISAFRKHGK